MFKRFRGGNCTNSFVANKNNVMFSSISTTIIQKALKSTEVGKNRHIYQQSGLFTTILPTAHPALAVPSCAKSSSR